jgi:hypothetical protein
MYCFDALKRSNLSETEHNVLFMEARDLFRKSPTSGQIGELLIYFLLEAVLAAPQAIRKMPLTTNIKEERKGSDGVHIRWDSDEEALEIYFAESKIWGDFTAALNDAFKSIKAFHSGGMRQHELNMFGTHFKLLDPELQARVVSYIEGENVPNTRLIHACVIGFDWKEYKCLDDARRKEFILEFEERYRHWGKDAVKKVEAGLTTLPQQLSFEFFFVPFKSVQMFRDLFEKALRG